MHAWSLAFVLVLAACNQPPAPAPAAAPAAGPAEQEIQPGPLKAHLRLLASDLMEGRAPSTRGGTLAAEYLATQLAVLVIFILLGRKAFKGMRA